MKEELVRIIVERLRRDSQKLKEQFQYPKGIQTHHAIVDDILPAESADRIYKAFPPTETMRLLNSFRERKFTSKSLDKMDPLVSDAIFAFQAPEVIEEVTKITGMKDLIGDPQLYAGGISAMAKGHFLNPHIDNSHDSERKMYRMLNLLYYMTPGWSAEFGGSFELWDERVKNRVEIPSLFNRLVIMETNSLSWHSVNEVRTDGNRCCVSNYYFSPHPPGGTDHFHVTFFQGRPEQHLRRLITYADSSMRTLVRKVIRHGVGKRDLYEGPRA